jgi:hypothetical protein
MDDPTRWCENDTNKWKRVTPGLLFPSKGPIFCSSRLSQDSHFWLSVPNETLRPRLSN